MEEIENISVTVNKKCKRVYNKIIDLMESERLTPREVVIVVGVMMEKLKQGGYEIVNTKENVIEGHGELSVMPWGL